MDALSQKRLTTVVVLISLIAITWLVYIVVNNSPSPRRDNLVATGENVEGLPSSKTRGPVPAGVFVPDQNTNAKDVAARIAIPETVLAASIGADANFRLFRVKVKRGEFSPDTVVARVGDSIRILFEAEDGSYDFTQPDNGLQMKLPQNVERAANFSIMTPGKFTYYCASCGGPEKGPVGYIVVVPR